MKTKAILATLLIAAAASADARFAWPYPPKAVSPDEIGHWVVINGNAWSHDVELELTAAKNRREVREKFPRRGTISRVLRSRHPESNSRFVKSWSSNA